MENLFQTENIELTDEQLCEVVGGVFYEDCPKLRDKYKYNANVIAKIQQNSPIVSIPMINKYTTYQAEIMSGQRCIGCDDNNNCPYGYKKK